jgi:hypothetical protein
MQMIAKPETEYNFRTAGKEGAEIHNQMMNDEL